MEEEVARPHTRGEAKVGSLSEVRITWAIITYQEPLPQSQVL